MNRREFVRGIMGLGLGCVVGGGRVAAPAVRQAYFSLRNLPYDYFKMVDAHGRVFIWRKIIDTETIPGELIKMGLPK